MMITINRRSLLRGAAIAALARVNACAYAKARPVQLSGCCALCAARGSLNSDIISSTKGMNFVRSSGDAQTDRLLGIALARLATTFKISPGFAFFDDADKKNAYALDQSILGEGQGTVLMGLHLFGLLMTPAQDAGEAVLSVLAHECGHIVQMQRGYQAALEVMDTTARPIELHADYLAGYYLSLRKHDYPDLDLRNVREVYRSIGDTDFASPDHHGTAAERSAALAGGFAFGESGGGDIDQAARAGVSFVRRMM
jgi:hypothetical protein